MVSAVNKALLASFALLASSASATPINTHKFLLARNSTSSSVSTVNATNIPLPASLFGSGIEAASVDANGYIFAADFRGANREFNASQAFARVFPAATTNTTPIFVAASNTTLLAGARFLPDGRVLIADAVNHQVVSLDRASGEALVYCSSLKMLQPNDIALNMLTATTIYLSGQNFTANTTAGISGDLWTCTGNGNAVQFPPSILAAADIHRTNGIETSPCGQYLYLSSATNFNSSVIANKVFRFTLDETGAIKQTSPTLFHDFAVDGTAATDVDGMRTDIDGNLYVTRNGIGKVVVLNSAGVVVKEIDMASLAGPSNLEFGGADGKSLVSVGRCADDVTAGCAAVYEAAVAGKAWTQLNPEYY